MIRVALLAVLLAPRPGLPTAEVDLKVGPVVTGINRFAFDLYREVRSPSENVAISPASLAPPIALLYEGARGETADEMARVFRFPARDALRRDFGALLSRWDGSGPDPGYRLVAANSLWGQKGHAFRPEYLRLAADVYRAPLSAVDFARNPDSARRAINAWVDGKTGGMIRELLGPDMVAPDTRLALVNSVYFKARWSHPFLPEATRPMDFHAAQGRTVRAPTMGWMEEIDYGETPEVQVISLPYRGGDVAMTIVLPRKEDGLAEVERSLTAERLDGWIAAMARSDVVLKLPKFRSTTRLGLGPSLAKLGMRAAFEPSAADFGGIADGPLWVSSVIQEVVVKVDEEGTEAAAATAIVAVGSAAPAERKPPVVFQADHPFLYLIRDVKSGAILFLGHVVDPTR